MFSRASKISKQECKHGKQASIESKRTRKQTRRKFYFFTKAGVFAAIKLIWAWGAKACALKISPEGPFTDLLRKDMTALDNILKHLETSHKGPRDVTQQPYINISL